MITRRARLFFSQRYIRNVPALEKDASKFFNKGKEQRVRMNNVNSKPADLNTALFGFPSQPEAQLQLLVQQQQQLMEMAKTFKPNDIAGYIPQIQNLTGGTLAELQDAIGPCAGQAYSHLRIEIEFDE